MNVLNVMLQQAHAFFKLLDLRRDVLALVMKNKCDEIIIPHIPCFTEIAAFIDQQT